MHGIPAFRPWRDAIVRFPPENAFLLTASGLGLEPGPWHGTCLSGVP